jgi:hypothetical protein
MDSNFWASYCNSSYSLCADGPFTPSGIMIKSLILHSGAQVSLYDATGSGGQNVNLFSPPDFYQGYGRLDLSKILPLKKSSVSEISLFVDQQSLFELTERIYTINVVSSNIPLKVE